MNKRLPLVLPACLFCVALAACSESGTDSSTINDSQTVQTATNVTFDIQVPAYQSDALRVELAWLDTIVQANWVGDEYWSAAGEFPTNSQTQLNATFSDDNGSTTLASFQTQLTTGSNPEHSFEISAEQFNDQPWDDDNDGTSNLQELIAGTNAFETPRILLFSETRGYAHESIPNALEALEILAASANIKTDQANDSSSVFTSNNLAKYDAIVWVLTSGDVLNSEEQSAFESYIQNGGGYAGIHAASDTEYDWPWYGRLVGAYFERHPAIQTAIQRVEDNSHVSTEHLNATWARTDEWYDYQTNPRSQVNVLLTLDENSYTGGGMGQDHPSAWFHEFEGGRSWYTGGGHTKQSYAEPEFRTHLLGGILYAAGINALETE